MHTRHAFLSGGGELARLIAAFDWSATPIGPISAWPQSLKASVGLVLRARVPMAVLWGQQGIMIYNDAYSRFSGKHHPGLLGLPMREGWHEVASFCDHVLKVCLAGGTLSYKDLELTLERYGTREPAWMNLDYSPLPDETGEPRGVLSIVLETTAQVQAERRERQALDARAESARRLQGVLQNMGEGFVLLNRDFRIVEINAEALAREERPAAELLGRTCWEVWPRAAGGPQGELIRRAMACGKPGEVEYGTMPSQGPAKWLELRAYPCDAGLALFFRDISERRQAVRALEDNEARQRAITEATPACIKIVGREGELLHMNAAGLGMIEAPGFDEVAGASVFTLVAPEHLPAWKINHQRVLAGERLSWRFDIISLKGRRRNMESHAVPLRLPDGTVAQLAVTQDITQHQRAEDALRQSEAQFRALAQAVPNQVWTATADGKLEWCNERVHVYAGTEPSSLDEGGMAWRVHPDDRGRAATEWVRAIAAGRIFETELRLCRADGTPRWHIARAVPICGEDGRISRWVGTHTDIHEQKMAHAAETRDRERLWNLSRDLLLITDMAGRIIDVNPSATRLLGWHGDEMAGRPLTDFVHPEDQANTAAEAARLARGETATSFENRLLSRQGEYRLIAWTAVPGDDRVHAVGRDMTDQRATEDALRQSQKMEVVGQLTGGIAHDFNNLLQGITGNLDLMQRRVATGKLADLDRFMLGAMGSAKRAAALTHRLLAFSRRQPLDARPVGANELVASMEDLLRRTLGEGVQMEMSLASDLWLTRCDPNQLESAILNLAINARDAMPEGGKLVIETCNAHLDSEAAAPERVVRPGQYVCICVTDSGTGMSPDTIAKAFEPFFTTKPIGQGTGLGLSMIYGFARQSEGYARIESELGKGTAVKIYLPRQAGDGAVLEKAIHAPEHVLRSAGETVLVIEDEAVVRRLIVEVLAELGYQALEAPDGPSGLEMLMARPSLDLLITDVGLPGMNGRQVAQAARRRQPELKVLLMTGYAENAALAGGFLEPRMGLITKPFPMETLATRVRQMIDTG